MMRHKLLLIIVLLVSISASASARVLPAEPPFNRLRFTAEWGYTQGFFLYRDYNFISEEGYRVYDRSHGFNWSPNAQFMARLGYPLSARSVLSLCTGYMGVGKDNRLLPVTLRYDFYPRSFYEDGIFVYAQGGTAWHIHTTAGQMALLASTGCGYRFRLCDGCALDLLVGVKYLRDHPALPDPERPGNVPEHNIRKNVAGYCALDFSVAISF